jgi:hypothetical protein
MSTKIVSTPSKPLNGEINKEDLSKIFKDYAKEVKLDSTTSRHFKKTDGFFLNLNILKSFIQQAEALGPDFTKIFCRFGVTLPHQTTCYPPYEDISNSLTVAFFIADKNNKVKDHVGDGVLTAGFKASQTLVHVMGGPGNGDGDLDCCANPHGGQ